MLADRTPDFRSLFSAPRRSTIPSFGFNSIRSKPVFETVSIFFFSVGHRPSTDNDDSPSGSTRVVCGLRDGLGGRFASRRYRVLAAKKFHGYYMINCNVVAERRPDRQADLYREFQTTRRRTFHREIRDERQTFRRSNNERGRRPASRFLHRNRWRGEQFMSLDLTSENTRRSRANHPPHPPLVNDVRRNEFMTSLSFRFPTGYA